MKKLFLFIPVFFFSCTQNVSLKGNKVAPVTTTSTSNVVLNAQESSEKQEMKIIMIVDNSGSMQESQEILAEGLPDLIDSVQNYNTKFYLYSTDVRSDSEIENSLGILKTTKGTLNSDSTYSYSLKNSFINSFLTNPDGSLSFKDSDEDITFQSKKNLLVNSIMNLGTSGRSHEKGIASLGHILANNSIFKEGDIVSVILISDEDDASQLERNAKKINEYTQNASILPQEWRGFNERTLARYDFNNELVSESLLIDVLNQNSPNLIDAIAQKIKKNTAPENFQLSLIMNLDDPQNPSPFFDTSCTHVSSSKGSTYFSLAEAIQSTGATSQIHSHPICNSNYSEAFQGIENFIKTKVNRSFLYALSNDQTQENLKEAAIIRGSQRISLAKEKVSIQGNQINIAEGLLEDGDQIELHFSVTKTE